MLGVPAFSALLTLMSVLLSFANPEVRNASAVPAVGNEDRVGRERTRRAESLSRRFQRSLRLWQSYCLRTRGEAPAFPTQAANRLRPS